MDDAVVIVVGDQGVGKSTLVSLLCHGAPPEQPKWTIGCTVDVKSYTSRNGRSHYIEFWDVGGTVKYERSRGMFYGTVNGIILVHDLTNRKSYKNLWRWLNEVLQGERGRRDATTVVNVAATAAPASSDDPKLQQRVGDDRPNFPIMLVGTKSDEIGPAKLATIMPDKYSLAQELGCQSVVVDATSAHSLANCQSQFDVFFDDVVERNHTARRSVAAATPSASMVPQSYAFTPGDLTPQRSGSFHMPRGGSGMLPVASPPPTAGQLQQASAAQHTDNLRRSLFSTRQRGTGP